MFYVTLYILSIILQSAVATCPNNCTCYTDSYYQRVVVDCSNSSFNEIPHGISNEVTHLYLQNNHITRIKVDQFAALTNLEVLDLRRNPLKIIPSYIFSYQSHLLHLYLSAETIQPLAFLGLSNLENLTITGNYSLTYIPKSLFKPLSNVRNIAVNYTRIKLVEKDMFSDLVKLSSIHMQHNAIETIEYGAFDGILNLKELHLDHNIIASIPNRTFQNLNNLLHLNISSNRIKYLDEETFTNLTSLENLALSNNNLQYLAPNIFKNLKNLLSLDLESNNVTVAPSTWLHPLYANVRSLYLSNNNLQTFSSEIVKKFRYLYVLHLRNTNLSHLYLPDGIYLRHIDISQNCFTGNLHLLKQMRTVFASESCLKNIPTFWANYGTIDLHGNDIVFEDLRNVGANLVNLIHNKIQNITFQCYNIYRIDLSYNNISDLSQSDFSGHYYYKDQNRLYELILKGNKITSIEADFKELINVQKLDLSENQIDRIHQNSFRFMTNLQDLNLSNNSLTSLGLQFNHILNLKSLDLSLNPIEKIDSRFLKSNKKLVNLNLSGNDVLKCSCDLLIVLQMLPSIKNINGHCTENNGTKKELSHMIGSISRISTGKCNLCKLPQICSHKGTCIGYNTTGFECQCIDGYKGRNCDISLANCHKDQTCGLCDNTKCKNEGRCVEITPIDFQCRCKTDFSGQFCEINSNLCHRSPCHNGGKCFRTTDQNFTCHCVNGFTGSNCDAFDCTKNQSCGICHKDVCKNHGQCVETSSVSFSCRCPSNYVGTYCENKIPCKPDPCVRGICITETNGTYKCKCFNRFTGKFCSTPLHDCSKTQTCDVCNRISVCKNNGVCIETSAVHFRCKCQSGFTGTFCEMKKKKSPGFHTGNIIDVIYGIIILTMIVILIWVFVSMESRLNQRIN